HVRKALQRQDVQPAPAPASDVPPGDRRDMQEVMAQASGLVDTMRASARKIPDPDVRRTALDACASADQALGAVMEHPEELPLARDFVNRFLVPASTVVSDYSRLANRNVPSARETLAKVERQDLPLITRKANELYDRLHRGTLIDLEVAREMLTRDVPDAQIDEPSGSGQ
ncbi:MAG TPA: 5-bromo-4-chloroindolyl phosphate hydrolysis family protein, partial [Thermomicrobiales bacterium]|nr:5-bromo-4-chloroindolyl phosphate hydrolysis family protein [Thermomicrobiales bacterium]